ncbi:MAG: dihydroorotate dehydrogenase electron transfer subunit [Candidatus Nitrosopelagicus sp.]|nr:dihydroorotate dehydrogenase electron transfer subunit [Candidatus Nitrosopelagicus sp.]
MEEQRDPNHPHICTIEKVVDETPTVRTLYFHDEVLANVKPGQFAMVWIPGVNELPMSVMISAKKDEAGFTVRKRGESSTALYNLKVGDKIGVRGPYGNSFGYLDPNKPRHDNMNNPLQNILLIGGGTGLVPLMRLQKYWMEDVPYHGHVTLLMGSKTKDEVFFENIAKKIPTGYLSDDKYDSRYDIDFGDGATERAMKKRSDKAEEALEIIPVTEDGSYGEKGYVTDVLEKLLEENKYDAIYTCGPELMMYKVVKLANEKGIFVQASLERMMKCGVGICGSCCVGQDLVCRDGTVFDGGYLSKNSEFGHFQRTKSGILEKI